MIKEESAPDCAVADDKKTENNDASWIGQWPHSCWLAVCCCCCCSETSFWLMVGDDKIGEGIGVGNGVDAEDKGKRDCASGSGCDNVVGNIDDS